MAAFLDSFYSVSVQCLKTPSEALNPQSQADMVTRVFWIAVSLLESDYEHEFLMAIHLLNKVGCARLQNQQQTAGPLSRLVWKIDLDLRTIRVVLDL